MFAQARAASLGAEEPDPALHAHFQAAWAAQVSGQPPVPVKPPVAEPARPAMPEPGQPVAPVPVLDDRPRIPVLPNEPSTHSTTPRPTKEVLAEYGQFVEERVDPRNTLDLVTGRVTLLRLKQPPLRVQLPDERVASYDLINQRDLAITGRSVGSTVLNLWFPDPADPRKEKILSYLVRVLTDPETRDRLERGFQVLQEQINRSFPDSVVHLQLLSDKLLISGQAKDIAEASQILRVVGVTAAAAPAIPVAQVNLNLNVGPEGAPPGGLADFVLVDPATRMRLPVVNLLRVPGEQQVLLRVTVAEVDRTAARSIGVNFSIFNKAGTQVFAQLTGNIAGSMVSGGGAAGTSSVSSAANNLPTVLDNGQIVAAVNALRNLNFARSLAEPTLIALHGQTASFQAGGQFPVPVVTGFTAAGLQGVSFVPFGVQLNFTPFITDKDRIRLAVSAEVSTRDVNTGTTVNGSSVSGLNTRNFQTTVELREGQTLAVAGLIQNNFGADSSRVPLFGDLPIIGRLGAFDQTSAGEQELIMLITPELVHPLEPKECPPLPGNDLFEPGDIEFYLLGRLESRRPYDYRSPVMTDIHRMARYRHCEQIYIFGPQGYADGKP